MGQERCGSCGNTIPSWANGVCYRCAQIEKESERYGQRLKTMWNSSSSKKESRYSPLPKKKSSSSAPPKKDSRFSAPPKRTMDSQKRQRTWSNLASRLEGFNGLLKDVYGRKVWLGELLERQGISPEQVRNWRQDLKWLFNFIIILEHHLMSNLAKSVPDQNPDVLSHWYGLNRTKAESVQAIAQQLGISGAKVIMAHEIFLKYLRKKDGRVMLEKVIIKAARESNQRR